jgi:glycosyltransferase involved in cell wall biosynthesis
LAQSGNVNHFPRITVVMPSFNQSAFLEEAICSVLDQNYPNLEFMILDGGSTDGSVGIIERYAERLAYWHSRPDKGQTDALIQGFDRATGDLMGWINSDDVLLPGALEHIARAYTSNPAGGLFGGNYLLIDQDSRIVRCKRHPANASCFARRSLLAVNQPGSFFSPRGYASVGGLKVDLHYVMDNDLYIRMLANGTQYAYLDKWLSGFRIHPRSKTVADQGRVHQEFETVRRLYWPAVKHYSAWQCLYKACQTANGNYLRMSIETLMARGKHWGAWANIHCRTTKCVYHDGLFSSLQSARITKD